PCACSNGARRRREARPASPGRWRARPAGPLTSLGSSRRRRRARETSAQRLLDAVLELLGIVFRRTLVVATALAILTELEVTGGERFVREDAEESQIVRDRTIDLAGPASGDQTLEPGNRLRGATCLHVREAAQPVELVVPRKSFARLGQQALDTL